MKKLLLTLSLLFTLSVAFSQEIPPQDDTIPHDPEAIWWGFTYTNISETFYYGYNRCYVEATEKYYVFWVKLREGLKYHEVDCETELPIGGWVDSL